MSSLEAPMRGLAAVIRRLDAPARLRASVGGFMAEYGVEGADLQAMQSIDADRWLVYRRLVFNRFFEIVDLGLPRTSARMGSDLLRDSVARFVEARASQSPYLRDVVGEFVAWAEQAWQHDATIEAWWLDLARHELLAFEVSSLPEEQKPRVVDELRLDAPVCFQDAARLVRYDWAVHELPEDLQDDTAPERRKTTILAYRDDEHRVRFLSLEPVAAEIIARLMARTPLGEAVREGGRGPGGELDDAVLAGTAELLADLAERGVIRGLIAEPA